MLTFVTGNQNKLNEVQKILATPICSLKLDLPEIQGSADEITINKCMHAAKVVNGPVLVEDTGLVFSSLAPLPGPYIKHFLPLGLDTLVLLLNAFPDKSCVATCTFGYTLGPNHPVQLFRGECNGTIVSPRGPTNFGWDPIFLPLGSTSTFAEMDSASKNAISHRSKAIALFSKFIDSQSV